MIVRESDKPRNILLLDGNHHVALFVARCLSAVPSLRLHALSSASRSPLRWSRHCRGFHPHAAEDDQALLNRIRHVVTEHDIDVLMPVMEQGVEFLSRHASELARIVPIPPVPSVDALRTAIDKGSLALFNEDHGIAQPATVVFDGTSESRSRAENLVHPVVVKPRRGMNGVGIQRFADPRELQCFLDQRVANGETDWIIQTWHQGYDVDCSVLCQDGRIVAYTIQQGIARGDREFMPSDGIRFVHRHDVLTLARRLMETLGWNGIAHIDMRVDESSGVPLLLEVNGRFWGTVMGSEIAGINFPYLYCQAAMGTSIPELDYEEQVFANAKAAIRSAVRRLTKRSHETRLPFRNTPLWYGLTDPAAELMRQYQLRFSE